MCANWGTETKSLQFPIAFLTMKPVTKLLSESQSCHAYQDVYDVATISLRLWRQVASCDFEDRSHLGFDQSLTIT